MEYVHLNPVRPTKKEAVIPAARKAELDGYEWSSHRDYGGPRKKTPGWLYLDWLGYWGRSRREAQRHYRQRMKQWFGQEVASPWERLERGLILGGAGLMAKVEQVLERKTGQEEWRWTREREADEVRGQLQSLLGEESDDRVKIWARVRLGGERGVDVAREHAYGDGSGVGQIVRRLERQAEGDKRLKEKLERMKAQMSRVQS